MLLVRQVSFQDGNPLSQSEKILYGKLHPLWNVKFLPLPLSQNEKMLYGKLHLYEL